MSRRKKLLATLSLATYFTGSSSIAVPRKLNKLMEQFRSNSELRKMMSDVKWDEIGVCKKDSQGTGLGKAFENFIFMENLRKVAKKEEQNEIVDKSEIVEEKISSNKDKIRDEIVEGFKKARNMLFSEVFKVTQFSLSNLKEGPHPLLSQVLNYISNNIWKGDKVSVLLYTAHSKSGKLFISDFGQEELKRINDDCLQKLAYSGVIGFPKDVLDRVKPEDVDYVRWYWVNRQFQKLNDKVFSDCLKNIKLESLGDKSLYDLLISVFANNTFEWPLHKVLVPRAIMLWYMNSDLRHVSSDLQGYIAFNPSLHLYSDCGDKIGKTNVKYLKLEFVCKEDIRGYMNDHTGCKYLNIMEFSKFDQLVNKLYSVAVGENSPIGSKELLRSEILDDEPETEANTEENK